MPALQEALDRQAAAMLSAEINMLLESVGIGHFAYQESNRDHILLLTAGEETKATLQTLLEQINAVLKNLTRIFKK